MLLEQLRAELKASATLIGADTACTGRLVAWERERLDALLEVSPRPARHKWLQVLPRRWAVGHTLSWLNRYHRMSKDYERRLVASGESMVQIELPSRPCSGT